MTQNSTQQTFDLAVRRHQSGQLPDAERLYRQVLAEHPNHAGAIHHLGLIALQTGRKNVAIQFIRQAIALQPGYAEAHCNLGNALRESGRPDEAALAYQKAIELKSNFPEAHNNLANVLADQGQFDEAIEEYRCAVALRPAYAQARNSLGNALRNKGRFDEAIAEIRQAISIDPNNPDAFSGLGNVFRDTGQLNEAISAYSQAIALRPAMPEAHNNLGAALKESGQLDKAIAAFREAISLRPNYAKAYSNLGSALKDEGLFPEAIEAFRHAISIDPAYTDAHSNLVYAMQFDAAYSPHAIAGELRRWNHRHAAPLRKFIRPHSNDRSPERPLRIGYVSADFRDHVVGRNLLPLFRNHDRREFEITCYAQVLRPDAITRDFQKTAREWRNIVGVSDEKLAEQIRADRIDILVDLSLHMAGNRLLVFARKPAPIQITFGGYPGGTGLETMDYRLTDPQLDPPGETESLYVEKSVRLPDSFWCYDPEAMGAPVDAAGPLPALQNGFVTFGCPSRRGSRRGHI
jgi:protein O-GlcNAc transferase